MKFSISILALLGVLAVVAEGRRCRPVGAALTLFDRKCVRRTDWEVVRDDGEVRDSCRCLGLTVKECIRCVYVQDPTTTSPPDVTTDVTDAPTDVTDVTTDVTDAPTDVTDVTTDVTDAPTDVTDVPTEGPTETVSTNGPTEPSTPADLIE